MSLSDLLELFKRVDAKIKALDIMLAEETAKLRLNDVWRNKFEPIHEVISNTKCDEEIIPNQFKEEFIQLNDENEQNQVNDSLNIGTLLRKKFYVKIIFEIGKW